jgi:uncharacterized protein YkwD
LKLTARKPLVAASRRRPLHLACVVLAIATSGGPRPDAGTTPSPSPRAIRAAEEQVFLAVQEERARREAALLERTEVLDAAAMRRAEATAARSPLRRLSPPDSVAGALRREGIARLRSASEQYVLLKDHPDLGAAALATWKGTRTGWESFLDPAYSRIGLGGSTAPDGTVVLVAILVEDEPPPKDPRALEREVFEAINRARAERGLRTLAWREELSEVAREHSVDMAARGYFAHVNPEGLEPADRVRARGIDYRMVAENIAENRGADDPAANAVASWLQSRGHLRNLLLREVTQTGVGVARSESGHFYFTQLFLRPARGRSDGADPAA